MKFSFLIVQDRCVEVSLCPRSVFADWNMACWCCWYRTGFTVDNYTVSPASAPIFTWKFCCCCGHIRKLCAWGVQAKIFILLCLWSYYPHVLAFVVMEGFVWHVQFMRCWVACDIIFLSVYILPAVITVGFWISFPHWRLPFTQPSRNYIHAGGDVNLFFKLTKEKLSLRHASMCGHGLSIRYLLFLI